MRRSHGMSAPIHRRLFLGSVTASLLASACKKDSPPAEGAIALPPVKATSDAMPKRQLGKTGVSVSIVGLGGFHLGVPDEKEAIRIVRTGVDRGINFLDNCWDYNGGESEVRMGKALRDGYRQKAFLMTKLDGRTKQAATGQLE